jgi:hypothetical protein
MTQVDVLMSTAGASALILSTMPPVLKEIPAQHLALSLIIMPPVCLVIMPP